MKLRALGTGAPFSRWPLIPASWLIQTEKSYVLINCPPQAGARLELLGVDLTKIGMIIPLGHGVSNIGGLEEFGAIGKNPYLVAPAPLIQRISTKIDNLTHFQVKSIWKVGIREEHFTDSLIFVDNLSGSYGFSLENARVFCTGSADVNEDWLFKNMDCDILLHEDRKELVDLPVYLQNNIWIHGYKAPPEGSDPLPMLYMPQGSFIYDSDRRDKVMSKERFIRENSKRVLGNELKA